MLKKTHPPNVPEIKSGVRIMWHSGYYDGVLSGICEYQGAPHYFECRKEYCSKELRNKAYRTFWIYRLLDPEWEIIKYWHEEWKVHVNRAPDYFWSETQKKMVRQIGNLQPGGDAYYKEMYYDRYASYIQENGSVEAKLDRYNQVVGYCIYDVLFGEPWKPWRRSHKKEAKEHVRKQEENP